MGEYDEDEHEDCEIGGAPMTVFDFLLAFFAFLAGVGKAFTEAMEFLTRSAAMANNYEADRRDFVNQARAEIEALPVAPEADNG